MLPPKAQVPITNTAVGAITVRNRAITAFRRIFGTEAEDIGYIYVRGVARSPTKKASEKLSVASEDKKRPSKRSEKDLIIKYCAAVGAKKLVRMDDRRSGNMLFITANARNTVVNI